MAKDALIDIQVGPALKLQDLDAVNNLTLLQKHVTNNCAKAIGKIVQRVLALAVEKAPVATGELRKSGTAVVQFRGSRNYAMIVGKGLTNGAIERKDLERLTQARGGGGRLKAHKINRIVGTVLFQRTNQWGEDVALWVHEYLLPYEQRLVPPDKSKVPEQPLAGMEGILAARVPETGPKYLETAYNESVDFIYNTLMEVTNLEALEKDIRRTWG